VPRDGFAAAAEIEVIEAIVIRLRLSLVTLDKRRIICRHSCSIFAFSQ
jgi:hypothetical protein